jgi:hypothetical protein
MSTPSPTTTSIQSATSSTVNQDSPGGPAWSPGLTIDVALGTSIAAVLLIFLGTLWSQRRVSAHEGEDQHPDADTKMSGAISRKSRGQSSGGRAELNGKVAALLWTGEAELMGPIATIPAVVQSEIDVRRLGCGGRLCALTTSPRQFPREIQKSCMGSHRRRDERG